MIRRKFDVKTIGALLITIMTVCLSAFAANRSSADAWTLNPSDFRYDMVLYFSISAQGYDNLDEYEIGAFIDDECRGLAENVKLPEGGTGLYMRIRSNSTEPQEISFIMRNKQTGKLYHLSPKGGDPIVFKSNEMVGMPSDPCVMSIFFEVKVSADENGTVDFNDGLYTGGTEIRIEAIPAFGYHFDSWSDGNKEADRTLTVTGDLNLVAIFAPNLYAVEFRIGDETIETISFPYGGTIVAPEIPAKEGYTFSGWMDIPATMPAEDIVLTASYVLNNYKLTFIIGDDVLDSKEIAFGTEIIAPTAPAIEGYTFSGWGDVPATMPGADLEFKGSYILNSYKLTFMVDNDVIEETELTYGSTITAPAVPDKEGYKFAGWLNLAETMPAADLTILGTYEKNNHLLSFMIDGQVIEERIVTYGDQIIAPEAPEKEGYTFSGWGDVPATMPGRDLIINATYTINSYKLTFVIDDVVIEAIDMMYGSEIMAPEAPAKEGYTFSGWMDIPATMPAGNLEVKGTYSINSYKLTFVIDDVVIEEKEMEYGSEIVAPATPDKDGHKFVGWLNMVPTMPASDLTILGTYEKNSHILTFIIDDVIVEERVVVYGSEIVAPEAPLKEGHTFLGWQDVPATMPAQDLVITGSYSVNDYRITFVVNGEVVESKWLPFGSEIIAPEVAAVEGFSFSGWGGIPTTMPAWDLEVTGSYNRNFYKLSIVIDNEVIEEYELPFGEEIITPDTPDKEGHKFVGWFNYVPTMPASDLTIFGTYEKNSHLLSFVIDGNIIEEKVVPFGSEIITPDAPVKLGYTFAGWENVPATMPAQDLVITGSYALNTYTVSFTVDGQVIATLNLAYGEEIILPEAPEREGYTFLGWGNVPSTMPAENLIFSGSYNVNSYRLLVYVDDEVYMDETLPYGAPISIADPVAPENMKFEGWSEEVPSVMPAHDVIIYGKMVEDTQTSVITTIFNGNDTLTVYNLNGVMLYKEVKANDIKERLTPGVYIINGKKVVIR